MNRWMERNWRWVMGGCAAISVVVFAVLLVTVRAVAIGLGLV